MLLADFKAKYSKQFARIGNNPNKKAVDWATDNGYRWIKIEEKNQGQRNELRNSTSLHA